MRDLQAGPELDRMVAERVMGWTWVEYGFYQTGPIQCIAGSQWYPSTDIRSAWEVLGKLPLTIPIHGCSDLATFMLARRNNGSWWAGYETPYQDGNLAAVGDTAPLAICRAALKAVGQ